MLQRNCLLLLGFIPFSVLSQEADSSKKVLPIEEVVVTGQFQPSTLKNSVYRVKTIARDYIERRGSTDMSTLLNMELGIRFSNDLVLGESDIQLMGVSGQNVKVLIDGVPLIDRGSSKQSLSQIDVNTIERIEIVEGPVSVMYGTDALAGVINIITQGSAKQNNKIGITARILEESVSSEYKPFNQEGRHNAHLGINYQMDSWEIGWNGSRNNFGGFQGDLTGRALQWQPKEQWLSSAKIGYKKGKINSWYKIDYANEDLYSPGPITANYKYIDKNYVTDRLTQVLQSQWQLKENLNLNGSFSLQHYKRSTITRLHDLSNQESELTTGSGEQDVSRFNQSFARINANYYLNEKIDFLVGIEADYDHASGARIQDQSEIYDFAGFVSAEYKPFEWIKIRPGIRVIHNSIYDAPPVVPSLNAKIDFNAQWALRIGYAMGFRAPSLRELYFTFHDSNHAINGNKNLEAEHNQNYNVNLNYSKKIDNGFINSSLSGFYNRFNNLISIGQDPNNSALSTYINIGKSQTQGLTWENSLNIQNSKIKLGISYIGRSNDLHEENRDLGKYFWTAEVNSSFIQEIPKWGANINLFYKLYGKRPSYQISGSGDLMTVNQASQDAYHQLDISVNKHLYKLITVQAGVRNLTNTTNVLNTASEGSGAHSTNNSSIPISYGRSFFFGLLYQFNK
ncbi:TonB-dependent receptor plug domain-containing protein [Sphingobacterium cellulitidis]|uniref:TonB-dependent receptor n=1 Tax=Sphingobacterium cellulitidis TaxID=1768011 RepID=A0A8H9KZ49_9SPHI|nr:TonB-dependent receptor [Sphingobacterium soli]MBA8988326.1 outer membrane receptor for ferrienterochelin and colicins [Sphingobacterium soli]GGE32097.1 TonB-dependent receptor [Sphingobacterium soli]